MPDTLVPRRGDAPIARARESGDDIDVLVAGGGPAGAAAALCLARAGHRVVMVERSDYERARVGETLSPGAQPLLDYLGLRERFAAAGHLPAYGNAAAWGSDRVEERDFLFTPRGVGWHLDRQRFDADLARAAEQVGATVWRRSSVLRLARLESAWSAQLRTPDGPRELRARFVVDATGKAQAVASRLRAPRERVDGLLALHAMFPAPADAADTFTLVEAVEQGWFYSSCLPARGAGRTWWCALMTDRDLCGTAGAGHLDAWMRALDQAPRTRARLGAEAPARVRPIPAHSARLLRSHGAGWAATGDAAASHDPLSSSGIARALDSGIHTARAVHAWLAGGDARGAAAFEALGQRQADDYARYLGVRAGYYGIEQRWPASDFWRRRQREITLDPGTRLVATPRRNESMPWPDDLAPLDAASLLAACSQPRAAAEIVASHPRRAEIGDHRLILGLQWLLEARALVGVRA